MFEWRFFSVLFWLEKYTVTLSILHIRRILSSVFWNWRERHWGQYYHAITINPVNAFCLAIFGNTITIIQSLQLITATATVWSYRFFKFASPTNVCFCYIFFVKSLCLSAKPTTFNADICFEPQNIHRHCVSMNFKRICVLLFHVSIVVRSTGIVAKKTVIGHVIHKCKLMPSPSSTWPI